MKQILITFIIAIVFFGCSKESKIMFTEMPKTYLFESDFDDLPNWENENYKEALGSFINSCKTKRTKNIYGDLCNRALVNKNPKDFLHKEFNVYKIDSSSDKEEGLLTGYYEPSLKGSLVKKEPYIYPIYNTPNDLISVDLSSVYPALKKYRLRGRIEGNRLVPYFTREETLDGLKNADIICYTDSKIDLFFLEVQGSGRVVLENGDTLFIGYANQNGQRYRSIGKYLVKIDALPLKDVSLQTITAWLQDNPNRIDEVLNYNKSVVYFQERKHAASGSLGIELTPKRSVAVDRSFIPLGAMLFLDATVDKKNVSRIVMAEDTGGAIKGALRADMFFGATDEAKESAGMLKSPLKLWILLPKGDKKGSV
ncbi:MAG: murein transglycosylase A [Campylobacterota bacterium]|nr:murein transglycosylase A [Campylobacterota bacterium]